METDGRAPIISAIDVGTNSFHMVTASVNHRGMLKIISRDKEMVRLGQSPRDMKYLAEDAIQRGIDTLKHFAKIAQSENAKIKAVATSAVREAQNKDEFIKRVKEETGIDIEVVSGAEEGRLIYIGVMHALPVYEKNTLVIDIGGGSTETVVGLKGEIKYVKSEKIGTIRMTKRFFDDGNSSKDSISECLDYIKGEWTPVMKKIREVGFDVAVGTSGTIQTLGKMTLALKNEPIPDVLNGLIIPTSEMLEVIDNIKKAGSTSKRKDLPGMEDKRADIILGGALIIEHAIRELNIEKMLISPYALREGIVFNTVEKNRSLQQFRNLSYLRYETIHNLARRFHVDLRHAEHVRDIALQIFDDLYDLHKLNGHCREILEAASLLHDAGYHISHDKHHKHSYYLIMHADMPGFTNDEAEMIANIARYHRKSHPKQKHDNFQKLSDEKKENVKILGGILRIAEGIDRRQMQIVDSVKTNIKNGVIDIQLYSKSPDKNPDIELWGAMRRKPLLEEAFKKDIEFHISKK